MGLGDKIENAKDNLVGKAKEAQGKLTDDEAKEAEHSAGQVRPEAGRREGQGRVRQLTISTR